MDRGNQQLGTAAKYKVGHLATSDARGAREEIVRHFERPCNSSWETLEHFLTQWTILRSTISAVESIGG